MLNHINNLGIHVTPEDKQRWNTAAEKSSGKDIDIDEYSTTEEVKQLIKDYVDNQRFITDIPECYETEKEVLLLLKTTLGNYTRSEDLDETLAQYTTLAALNEFEQSIHKYLEQFKQDVLEDTKYVTAMQFSDVSRDLTLTQSDGTTLSVNIPGGGGGSSVSAYLMMEAIAYCNVSSDVTPVTPEGGSYNFNTYILTPPHDPTVGSTVVWANSQNGMIVDSTHSIYISKRVFSNDPDAPTTSWSQPLLYSGSIQTETTNVQVYSTEVAKVFTVYCEGTVQKITDPVSGEVSYRSVPPSNVSHAPEGGTYDRANDTLSSNPHTYGVPSEYWTLNRPVIPSTWTDPDTEQSEDPVTFSKACYFSIGTVKSDNSLEWSAPSIYGIDYVIQASNLKFIAINYSVLASKITLSTDDLAVVAEHVELKEEQLSIIAQYVSIDAPFTQFRGEVQATSFTVAKDNAYYEEVTNPETQETSVVKKTDIDQKLFQIALNKEGQTTHDSESDDDDVLMLIYNPGVLTGHSAGTEEHGQGQKGELTGNNVEFIINPKRISYNRFLSYYCHTDTEYWIDNNDALVEHSLGKRSSQNPSYIYETHGNGTARSFSLDNCLWDTFPESVYLDKIQNTPIVLPDPKTYRGATIKGTIDTSFTLRNNNGNGESSYEGFHPEINIVSGGGTENVNICSNNTQAIECVVNDQLCNLYNMYRSGNHPYTPQTGGTVYIPWNTIYMSGLPRIEITSNSAFQFVRINAYSDQELIEKGILDIRNDGIVSLDRNFYKDWASVAYNIITDDPSVPSYSTYEQRQLCRTATPFDVADWYDDGSSRVDYVLWKSHMNVVYDGNQDDKQTPVTLTNKLTILPSPTGIYKIAHGMPLTFDAVAVETQLKNVPMEINGGNVADVDGEFYYWDIKTQDFHVYYDIDYDTTIGGQTNTNVNSIVPILPIMNIVDISDFLAHGPAEDAQVRCYQSGIAVTQLQSFLKLVVDLYDFNFKDNTADAMDTNRSLRTLFSNMNIHDDSTSYTHVIDE